MWPSLGLSDSVILVKVVPSGFSKFKGESFLCGVDFTGYATYQDLTEKNSNWSLKI